MAKAKVIYEAVNRIGEADEVPVKDRTSMDACIDRVERDEGLVQTINTIGGGRPFVVVDAQGKK